MNTDTMPGSVATRRISAATRATSSSSCMRRYRARTEEPALALRHVVRAPVVVRAGLYFGEVDVALALQGQEHGRVQDGEVDVVLVHVLQARLRVPCRGTRLRVAHLAAERARPVLVARTGHTGGRHAVGRRSVPVVEEPLLAVVVGLDVPDAVPVRRGCVVGHRGRVLEDVPVGVDVTKAVRGRHPRSSLSSPSEYTTRPRPRQRDARTRRRDAAARSRPSPKCHTTPRTPRKPELSVSARGPTDRAPAPRVTTEQPLLLLKCSVSKIVVELLDEREEPRPQPDPRGPVRAPAHLPREPANVARHRRPGRAPRRRSVGHVLRSPGPGTVQVSRNR